jgi:AhpD family alkylhydroperoxidase
MRLDERILRLIAVGASISANCQPCLQASIAKAQESGADPQEIAEAIWVGTQVRQGAASKMDKFAASIDQAVPLTASLPVKGCECG